MHWVCAVCTYGVCTYIDVPKKPIDNNNDKMKQREKNASQPATNNTFKNTQTPNTLKWLGVYAKKWVYQPFCNILFCKSRTKIANAKSGRASISMARHMEMDGIQQQTNRKKKNVCVLQQVKKIFFVSVFELASGNQFLSHMGSSAFFFSIIHICAAIDRFE